MASASRVPPVNQPASNSRRVGGGFFHDAAYNPTQMQAQPIGDDELRPPDRSAVDDIHGTTPQPWRANYEIDEMTYEHLDKSKSARTLARYEKSEMDRILREAQQEATILAAPPENPHVERKVKALCRDWATYAEVFEPGRVQKYQVGYKSLWFSDFIMRFAVVFLVMRLKINKGRAGGRIKAVTLFNWASTLIKCIIRYSRGPDGTPNGNHVLLDLNLHTAIRISVKSSIKMYNLDRYQNNKLYYGRWEVLLILAWLLSSSQNGSRNERLVKMQTACLVIICFYIVTRPGSLAPSCDEFLQRRLLLLLGDVKIYLLNGIWQCRVAITIRSWKGQSERLTATQRVYHLDAVTKAHNVILDPTVWIVTYMLCRGAFGPQYKTLKDLEGAKQAVLEVVPEKRDEPFFLAITEGGHDLVPGKAATVQNISQTFRHATIAAGLPAGSIYALRRDGGNDFSLKAGAVVAALSLGHNNPGSDNIAGGTRTSTFHQHYSRVTADMPYTDLRLGETQEKTDQMTMRRLHMLDFMRKAIDAWINMKASSLVPLDMEIAPEIDMNEVNKSFLSNSNLTDHSKVLIWTNQRVSDSRKEVRNRWANYMACFPAEAKTFHHDSTHATPTISKLLDKFPRRFASPQETYECEQALRDAIERDENIRKAVTKPVRQAQKKGVTARAFDDNRPENTFDNRNDAGESLTAESTRMLTEAVARQRRPPASVDSRGVHPSEILRSAGSGHAAVRATITVEQPPVAGPSSVVAGGSGNLEPPSPFDDPYRDMDLTDDPEPSPAPWDRPDDRNAWDAWRRTIATARTRMEDRAGSLADEYQLAQSTTLASEMIDAEKALREREQELMPPGNENAHLLAMQSEAGVPPRPRDTDLEDEAESEEDALNLASDAGTMTLVSTQETPATAETAALIIETYTVADDKEEPEVLGVPCPHLRAVLAADIVDPVEKNRVIEEGFEKNGRKCPLCRKFIHNGDADRVWPDRGKLEYHMRVHTAWHDLPVEMMSPDCRTWTCPSCSATATSVQAIQSHCVNKCRNKMVYLAMQAEHNAQISHQGQERRRENKVREMEVVDERKFESDGNNDIALAMRNVILDIRNWNIHQMVDQAIAAGRLPESHRVSKTRALEIMQDFSQRSWECPEFYFVPIKLA